MRYIKTIALCALVALGVTAASATAASLITSANIKDGTIKVRDLSPALQAKINTAGKPGATGAAGANGTIGATGATGQAGQAGANGLDGANGVNGQDGTNGQDGINGTNGVNGTNGLDGKDGVRYDRLTGGRGRGLGRRRHGASRCARPRCPGRRSAATRNLKLSEISELSFSSNASHAGVVYLKLTTEGHDSVVFSPNTQAGGEKGRRPGPRVTARARRTVRLNDDAGARRDVLERPGRPDRRRARQGRARHRRLRRPGRATAR